MKFILLLIFSFLTFDTWATCSSPISRTNSSPNSVLTSTKYNLDLNTVYTKVNDLDGDCITDDSISFDKIDQTTLQPLAKGVKEGCLATRSDANTISVDKCLISVSGTQIEKTTATTVTWGCGSCSSEVASTTYYVYATNASTLTLKISTTAPDAYGYNSTDRVLAKFFNDASSNIQTNSIQNWVVNGFTLPVATQPGIVGATNWKVCRYLFGGASVALDVPTECAASPCVELSDPCGAISPPTRGSTGVYTNITIADGTFKASSPLDCRCVAYDTTATTERACLLYFDTSDQTWSTTSAGGYVGNIKVQNAAGTLSDGYVQVTCEGEAF